jgi:hypothetical protein
LPSGDRAGLQYQFVTLILSRLGWAGEDIMRNTAPKDAAELEALETREWLESLD